MRQFVSTASMDRPTRKTPQKSISQDRKGSRSTHPRRDRKRSAGFKGTNRHFIETDTTFASTSAAKIGKKNPDFEVKIDQTFSYCLIEFCLVFGTLQQLLKCKKCNSDVKFYKKSIRGLGFKISVDCLCSEPAEINSCPLIKNAYEINRRFCFVMRMLGIGIHGIKNFTALMDLASTFNSTTYYGIVDTLHIAVKSIYEAVIRKAGTEEKQKNSEAGNRADILTVSGEGSWSKRGFSSRMGILSVIGKYSNKVLDVAVTSSFCKACLFWKGKENTVEFEAWNATHEPECNVNHEGSAGKMEVDGMIEIFKRSEELHNAKYGFYIGDGDTKTFKMLLEAKPYGDSLTVKKKECDDVQEVLKPVSEDLTTDDLLERCTGANTQNNNESFNHCVWQLAPKHIFCGKETLEIATYCAACIFNEGYDPILKILETMGVIIGPAAADFATKYKTERIATANRRSSLYSKDARTARRNEIAAKNNQFEETEGILYGSGIAD